MKAAYKTVVLFTLTEQVSRISAAVVLKSLTHFGNDGNVHFTVEPLRKHHEAARLKIKYGDPEDQSGVVVRYTTWESKTFEATLQRIEVNGRGTDAVSWPPTAIEKHSVTFPLNPRNLKRVSDAKSELILELGVTKVTFTYDQYKNILCNAFYKGQRGRNLMIADKTMDDFLQPLKKLADLHVLGNIITFQTGGAPGVATAGSSDSPETFVETHHDKTLEFVVKDPKPVSAEEMPTGSGRELAPGEWPTLL